MSRILAGLISCVIIAAGIGKTPDSRPTPPSRRVKIMQLDHRIRSAYLLRVTGADRAQTPLSSAENVAQLRAHFDAVLELLAQDQDVALEIALARLEAHRGEMWSPAERQTWSDRLATERAVNIQRLREYQRRGQFPINEHADHAVPVFVDNYGTDCAVGHLMRESGWREQVDGIQKANNFVYLTDVREGPAVEWVVYSGLLQEEAATIQPGYGLSGTVDAAATYPSIYSPPTLTARGLSYSNFIAPSPQLDTLSVLTDPDVTSALASSSEQLLPDLFSSRQGRMDVSLRHGPAGSVGCLGCGIYEPDYERWSLVTSYGQPIASSSENTWCASRYGFDLSAVNGNQRVDAISLTSNYTLVVSAPFIFSGVQGFGFARVDVFLPPPAVPQPGAPAQLLASRLVSFPSPSFPLTIDEVLTFAPQQQVHVEVLLFSADGFSLGVLGHEVSLITVPEPSHGLAGLVMGALPVAMCRRQARRRIDASARDC